MPTPIASGTTIAYVDTHDSIVVGVYPDMRTRAVGKGQNPSLSPDGGRVAYEETSNVPERHFVIRDTRTGSKIAAHPGTTPHFSPDGTQIAFSRFVGSKWTAWVINATLRGSAAQPLIARGASGEPPAFIAHWTAAGLIVAYSETLGGAVYALKPDGTVVQKVVIHALTHAPETMIPMGCAWSDDLSRLVFEAETGESIRADGDGNGEPLTGLFLYDAPTKRLRQLTPHRLGGGDPVWYDQDTILFTGAPNRPHTESAIYAQAISGGAPRVVVPKASDFAIAVKKL